MKANEIVKVETWVITLNDENTGMPAFYYNPDTDKFEREFSNPCGYWEEKPCLDKLKELQIDSAEITKGSMDVPKNILAEAIAEVFIENGLVK